MYLQILKFVSIRLDLNEEWRSLARQVIYLEMLIFQKFIVHVIS